MIPATWSLAARVAAPLLVLAVAGALIWGYGRRQNLAGLDAGRAEVREQMREQIDAANLRAQQAEASLVAESTKAKTRAATRDKELTHALPADWRAVPLPDGVRSTTEAAAADALAGWAD